MTPLELVQGQLEAYNAGDVDRFCTYFADDIVAYSLKDDRVLIRGLKEFRETYTKVFAGSPNLNAKILSRTTVGDFVIDHEDVTGRLGADLKAVAIYRITAHKISHVWFAV